ncbi:GTP cyclohydrolase I, partial [Plasmodium cynomolgi strain B]
MFKRGDLSEGKHCSLDSVGTYEERSCTSSEAAVKDAQLVGASGSEDQREGRNCVLSISPMDSNLGLGLFRAQNGVEENGGRWNNYGDGDDHLAYTSQPRSSFINKDSILRYNGISISGKVEKMTDGRTNAGVLNRLSEESCLGKARQDISESCSTEAPPACAICREAKRGAVNGVRRKVIKRVEKKDHQGSGGDGGRSDTNRGDTNRGDPPP